MKNPYITMALLICTLFVVAGCQFQSELLSEKSNVGKKVTETIDDEATLQLIYDGSKGAYVVLRSSKDVKYNAFIRNKKATIQFTVSDEAGEDDVEDVEEFIYYLKQDSAYDTIQVFINDKEVPFNLVTSM